MSTLLTTPTPLNVGEVVTMNTGNGSEQYVVVEVISPGSYMIKPCTRWQRLKAHFRKAV